MTAAAALTDQQRLLARAELAGIVALLRPATRADKVAWLAELASLVRGPVPLAEAEDRLCALADALDFPFAAFTPAAAQRAQDKFCGLPDHAALAAFLREEMSRIHRRCAELRRAIGGPHSSATRAPPSAEQIARVERAIAEAGLAIPQRRRA